MPRSTGMASIDQYAGNSPAIPPADIAKRRTRKIILLVTLLVLGGLTVFVAGIFMTVEAFFRSSPVYHLAVEKAHSSAAVRESLGEPIREGWLVTGSLEESGGAGHAEFNIPLSGSKHTGKLFVEASRHAGRWEISILRFQVEGEDQQIDLLTAASR
jgi:hypothetical protein